MGGGGSKCSKVDSIDPKPSVDMNAGVSVAGSRGCKSCSLVYPQSNTASMVSVTRKGNMIVMTPSVPFTAVFNGIKATFSDVRLFYPSPIRIEGVQADGVIQCVDDNLTILIPLKKSEGGSGLSSQFLTPVASRLNPANAEGLGLPDNPQEDPKIMESKNFFAMLIERNRVAQAKAAGTSYLKIDVPTGQDWALTNLVKDTDPYFTWVNSTLEQYTRADYECVRYLGWRSTSGAQVIFYQNPVPILEADFNRLTVTVGPVKPSDVLSPVTNPLYRAGKATGCSPSLPPLKLPSMKLDSKLSDFVMYIFLLAVMLLAVVFAVAIVNSDSLAQFGKGVMRLFSWGTPAKAAAAPSAAPPNPLGGLGALAALAGKKGIPIPK
jgi:hypothetical protein